MVVLKDVLNHTWDSVVILAPDAFYDAW